MKQTMTRRRAIRVGGVAVACSGLFTPASIPDAAATAQNGELSVDVVHESGEQATEVNALVIWQDEVGGSPYDIIENYPSVNLPYNISGLPAGHEYLVNAYINDQLTEGTGWVMINSNDSKSREITVANSIWIRPRIFDTTGENPLENATVEVRTHEDDPDYKWRSAETNSEGYVETPDGKLWLHPTGEEEGVDEGYYLIDVLYRGDKVAGERIDTLVSNRDMRISTSASTTPTDTPTLKPTDTPSPSPTETPTSTSTRTATSRTTEMMSPPANCNEPQFI